MKKSELFEKVMNVLKDLDDAELVSVWNEYCSSTNKCDDYIESMDNFDELYSGYDPLDVAMRVFYGHDEWNKESSFNPNRDFFYLNGYGNPVSIDYIGYNEYADKFMCPVLDEDALADFITDNMDSLYNDDLQELLDNFEEENARIQERIEELEEKIEKARNTNFEYDYIQTDIIEELSEQIKILQDNLDD